MANYAPADARAVLLFSRRRTPAGDLYDQLKFRRIAYDPEQPGDDLYMWEPLSSQSLFTDSQGDVFGGLVQANNTPVIGFEILDGHPKDSTDTIVMQID